MKGTFVIYSPLIHTSQLSSVIGPCECQVKAIYKVGVAPSVVAEKVKVGITPSMVSEKVKDGKVSLATDTLQAENNIAHPIEHTEVVVPHVDRPYTQLRTSPKKGKPGDYGATRIEQVEIPGIPLKDLRLGILLLITLFGTLSVEFITSYNQRTDNGPVLSIRFSSFQLNQGLHSHSIKPGLTVYYEILLTHYGSIVLA
ncbi:hypothetical protein P8452_09481 [Trifolium repens]|nr:hypothetical protein P8452_09481 [Trifolium repens]